jgi:hypothetical protein
MALWYFTLASMLAVFAPTVRLSLQSAARAPQIQIGNIIKEQRGAAEAAPIVIAAPATNICQTIERLPFGAVSNSPRFVGADDLLRVLTGPSQKTVSLIPQQVNQLPISAVNQCPPHLRLHAVPQQLLHGHRPSFVFSRVAFSRSNFDNFL